MLPTAGSQADGKSGSFQNMLSKYGLASSVTGSADGVNYNIAAAPLYFVRSGEFNIGDIWGIGLYGHAWSSTPYSTTNYARYFLFHGTGLMPNRFDNRYYGYPLRCLSTVLGM